MLPCVAAGALVKVPVALIGPVLFVGVLATQPGARDRRCAAGIGAGRVVYRPFWEGPQTLTALQRTDLFTASLGSVLRLALAPSLGLPDATASRAWTSLGAFAVVAVLSVLRACARRDRRRACCGPAYFTCSRAAAGRRPGSRPGTSSGRSASGAALAEPRRHLEVALLSLGGLLQYFVFIYLWVIGVFPPTRIAGRSGRRVRAIVGPLRSGALAARRDGAVVQSTELRIRGRWKRTCPARAHSARATPTAGSFSTARCSATTTRTSPPMTHALHYGTGCFEGIRAYWNAAQDQLYLLQAEAHYARLRRSAAILRLELPHSNQELIDLTARDPAPQRGAHGHLHSPAGVRLRRRDRRPAART